MKTYIYCAQNSRIDQNKIRNCLSGVADSTDTSALVVSLYLMPGVNKIRGTAYAGRFLSRDKFTTGRGKWAFTGNFGIPADLPRLYKLIRLRIDSTLGRYPYIEKDIYGWKFLFPSFYDHLATLFAHELHHFRRYHLDLHPGKGEQSANKWAVQHIKTLGYEVSAKKTVKRKNKGFGSIIKKFPILDPYSDFRRLNTGDRVKIKHDPFKKYINQTAKILRPIRTNSKRMVIETNDGKSWRWPLEWIERMKDKG